MRILPKISLVILLLIFTFSLSDNLTAAVPHLINYQGKLTDSNGVPLNGTYNITFRIYNAQVGGNLLWEEPHTQANGTQVTITNGIFSIMLGSVTALNLAFDQPYWLSIQVGGDPEMTPRQQITSVGYSIRSETAELANNATAVNNIQASTSPEPNKLLPLNDNAKLPTTALKVYDSGWFAVSSNNSYTKTHNLGTTKCIVQVYLSPNSDGSGGCYLNPDWQQQSYFRGAYMATLSSTSIGIRCTDLLYQNQDINGNQVGMSSGYIRIIIIALD